MYEIEEQGPSQDVRGMFCGVAAADINSVAARARHDDFAVHYKIEPADRSFAVMLVRN